MLNSLLSIRRGAIGVAAAGLTTGAILFGGTPIAHAAPPPGPGISFDTVGPHGGPDLPLKPGGGGGGHGGGGGGGHGGGGWGGGGHGGWGGPGGWGGHGGWAGHGDWDRGVWGHPGWGNGGWGPPGQGYRPWWPLWNWWW